MCVPWALARLRPSAVRSKMRRRSSFAATPRIAKTISAKSEVVSRYGSARERLPAPARCISRAITSKSVVSRDSGSTAGGYHHVAGGKPFHQLAKLRPVGRGAGELLPMLDRLAPGDVVTVTRIGRLARSTFDLFGILKRIVDAKAQIPIIGGTVGRHLHQHRALDACGIGGSCRCLA